MKTGDHVFSAVSDGVTRALKLGSTVEGSHQALKKTNLWITQRKELLEKTAERDAFALQPASMLPMKPVSASAQRFKTRFWKQLSGNFIDLLINISTMTTKSKMFRTGVRTAKLHERFATTGWKRHILLVCVEQCQSGTSSHSMSALRLTKAKNSSKHQSAR